MKDHKYKMTVIMPSYNNGIYIRQALDSILMQETGFNYQIIVTDDCSQDNSPEIIAEYEVKYPEKILALYSQKNCRLFCNVLKALEKMDSEYFCVLDPDDYWTDPKRLQKAVDFLDKNTDYTIYATNLYKIFNDGTIEIKYDRPGMNTHTSTYIDYLNGKAVLSCTPSSTYRNVYFSGGIPQEYLDLKGTLFEEIFRADTARNLLHLIKGKAYFVNEITGYCRYHGKGLASSLLKYEMALTSAFGHIGYYMFFGKQHEAEYVKLIKNAYKDAIKEYLSELINGNIPKLSKLYKEYLEVVVEWLQVHDKEKINNRIPFSLSKFSETFRKKTIIWGTGTLAVKIINEYNLPIHEDTFFVDNNPSKQGTNFMGKPVKAPCEIKKEKDYIVIIASSYYKEIIGQIEKEELCSNDMIVNIYDFRENWIN